MTEEEKTEWFSEDTATFGDRLAAAREAASMTQKDLAKKLGVKLGTLRNWEDDLNEPRANKLQMVSGLLGVSLRWLLTGEGDGIDLPEENHIEASDLRDILLEMRSLRAQMVQSGEKLAQLEKRLRAVLSDAT
ncbi:helix-turn-helix domain-containing protein [Salibaculum griseiflavum]|jgi:transcriptional regulator with XRE-family HTH domain|uniref:Transcriptional regulator n=1 Tax=Salibaculum griseiflavum TaxID=1914409 RepID=A0A2V1P7M5_9RHOB|nr:helix-turn-helix domain-containing protein [Salibaculum griseiflavum]PWG17222.1 transcriptional regulator [Salibaculum griseiflavum]